MAEDRKYKNVLAVIPEKNVQSFAKWYNSMRRPLAAYHSRSIVCRLVQEGFTEGIRILVEQNGVGCLSLGSSSHAFRLACEYEQVEIVKFLLTLDTGDNILTSLNRRNMDALAIAAEKRNEELFNVLLASGKFSIENIHLKTVSRLFNALENGQKELAMFLIQHGANIKSVGVTPGLESISSVCISAMKIPSLTVELLKRGGNPNDIHEKTGKSVLQLAIEANADRCTVKGILLHGAKLGWKDKYGGTALTSLKSTGQLYGIIDAGVTIKEIEKNQEFSTLGFVLEHPHGDEDMQFFLGKGAGVNFGNEKKDFLLIRAVKSRYLSEKDVLVLLQNGANPNQKNIDGYTALQIFCKCKLGSTIKIALHLLEYGAEPVGCLNDVVNKALNTEECIHLVEKLLKCGADPNEETGRNESILSTAIRRNLGIAEELIIHGANTNAKGSKDISPLSNACQLGMHDPEFKSLRALLKRPTNLNYSEYQVHIDAVIANATEHFQRKGNQRILTFDLRGVFYLLSAGVDLIPKQRREEAGQRITWLAQYGLYKSIEVFLRCGLCTNNDKEWMKNISEHTTISDRFETNDGWYCPQISEDKRLSLEAALNELHNIPTSLQKLCRSRIREELAVRGQSVLPLIEELPIPEKLKSFLKFADVEQSFIEEVTTEFTYRPQTYQYDDFDYSDHYDDYDPYDDYDYYDNDRQEMIFDTSADEWVPIWW